MQKTSVSYVVNVLVQFESINNVIAWPSTMYDQVILQSSNEGQTHDVVCAIYMNVLYLCKVV